MLEKALHTLSRVKRNRNSFSRRFVNRRKKAIQRKKMDNEKNILLLNTWGKWFDFFNLNTWFVRRTSDAKEGMDLGSRETHLLVNQSLKKLYPVSHIYAKKGLELDQSTMQQTLKTSLYTPELFKPTMPFLPELPLLKAIANFSQTLPFKVDFKDVIFVCGQHLLNTTINLIKFLIDQGAIPNHIFIIGKNYSNNEAVIAYLKNLGVNLQFNSEQLTLGGFNRAYNADVHTMWENCYQLMQAKKNRGETIKGIIILDDGGHVSSGMPMKIRLFQKENTKNPSLGIVCIEQTSSGMAEIEALPFPIIEVATTAIKQWIEPPLVAAKCVKEIKQGLSRIQLHHSDIAMPDQPTIGIVGLGKIGYAILEEMIKIGYKNFVIYDKSPEKRYVAEKNLKNSQITIENVNELLVLFVNSDIIIGCTGYDITANTIDLFKTMTIKSPKILASCSSKDTEFRTLLQHIQKYNRNRVISPLEDIFYKNGFKAPLVVLRGGTPIGFTNDVESVFARGIEPIRGLKAMACLQAYSMLMTEHKIAANYMLHPEWQAFIAREWLTSKPPITYPNALKETFTNVDKIKENSGGIPYDLKEEVTLKDVAPIGLKFG